jgi:hypothetical protein
MPECSLADVSQAELQILVRFIDARQEAATLPPSTGAGKT